MIKHLVLLYLLALPLLVGELSAQETVTGPHIEVSLLSDYQSVNTKQPFWIAVHFKPDEHWHTYWRNPGDSGQAPKIQWQVPDELKIAPAQWPIPVAIDVEHLRNFGYLKDSALLFKAELLQPITSPITIIANASWLVCEEVCIPGDGQMRLSLGVGDSRVNPESQAIIERFEKRLPDKTVREIEASVDGQALVLSLPKSFAGAGKLDFFPLSESLIEHPVDGKWTRSEQGVSGRFALSPMLLETPKSFTGLITVDNDRGHYINATVIPAASTVQPASDSTALSYTVALLFAFLGGLILNIMPCVFPVLALKALSLSKLSNPADARHYGIFYFIGILSSFLAIAGIMIAIRLAGEQASWGFQLQEPWFVILLCYLFFTMALALFGLFSPGARLMGLGTSSADKPGRSGAFFTGLLAVLVASPCSAPLMAPALGLALQLSPVEALLVFASLATGFASPLVLLAFYPKLSRLLPKPGAWMNTFKEAMAFPLLLSVVWLLWVLSGLTSPLTVAKVSAGLVAIAAALWLLHRGQNPVRRILALGLIGLAAMNFYQRSGVEQEFTTYAFSKQNLEQFRSQNKTVFVNFTADWCITCKVNEGLVFSDQSIRDLFAKQKAIYMVGDFTKPNPEIADYLDRYDRSGVPLYLVYHGTQPARVLPQLLTPNIVAESISINQEEQL